MPVSARGSDISFENQCHITIPFTRQSALSRRLLTMRTTAVGEERISEATAAPIPPPLIAAPGCGLQVMSVLDFRRLVLQCTRSSYKINKTIWSFGKDVTHMTVQRLRFDGRLLQRGFWIYIWRISNKERRWYYVGRTGDNSSVNAASPFSRLSDHFNTRSSASANMILRHLNLLGVDSTNCFFEMLAIGPLYLEQTNMEDHLAFRDRTAAIESATAKYIHEKGQEVMGKHPRATSIEGEVWNVVKPEIDRFLSESPDN